MKNNKEKLHDLILKKNLSHEEMEEFKRISLKDSWKIIGNWKDIGARAELKKVAYNFQSIGKRIQHAINSQCYIEAISLRLILIEIVLRLFLKNKGENLANKTPRELQFGSLLGDIKRHDFDSKLFERLEDFNKKRIEAIHNFVYQGSEYNSFFSFIVKTDNLATDVWDYCVKSIK